MDIPSNEAACDSPCAIEVASRAVRRSRPIAAAVGYVLLGLAAFGLGLLGDEFSRNAAEGRLHLLENRTWHRMLNIRSAQAQFQSDGASGTGTGNAGRHGFLSELLPLLKEFRGNLTNPDRWPSRSDDSRDAVARLEQGRLYHDGYVYEIYLPAKGGGWASEVDIANGKELDLEASQRDFLCYAWPQSVGRFAASVMAVDASGDPRVARDKLRRYVGDRAPIVGITGFGSGGLTTSRLAHASKDVLGDYWVIW